MTFRPQPFDAPAQADSLLLGAHKQACDRARARSFLLQCAGERVHAVLGPRLVTTVAGATALMALLAGCI